MFDEKSHSLKMNKAIDVFSKELSSLSGCLWSTDAN